MKTFRAEALLPLLSLAGAAVVSRQEPTTYDAIIVGGGPAGLAFARALELVAARKAA